MFSRLSHIKGVIMKVTMYSLVALMLLSGCDFSTARDKICDNNVTLDSQLSSLISEHKLTGNPATGRDIPSITDAKAQLGMKLFFTKTMSIDGDTACVTCHHPMLGGGDGSSITIGTGATDTDVFGNSRTLDSSSAVYAHLGAGPTQSVNAPTTYNSALKDRFMAWHGIIEAANPTIGLNGSVGGLYTPDSEYADDNTTRLVDSFAGADLPAAQSRFPVQNPIEMAGYDSQLDGLNSFGIRKILFDRFTGEGNTSDLGTNYLTSEQRDAWKQAFDAAGVAVTDANIYDMISYYERTQLFIENPWKKYIDGDKSALSDDAKKGAILFYSSYEKGGANCVYCHSGDSFTDNALHVMAVPQIGHGTQPNGDSYGREDITHNRADRYKWRTISLLNVEKTGPWSHDGAFTSLKAMVKHMVDPSTPYDQSNVLEQDMQNLNYTDENHAKAVEQLEKNRLNGVSPHRVADLNDEQINQIVEFLDSLTDSRLNDYEFMKKWVPLNNDEAATLNLQVNVSLPSEATSE